MKARSRAPGRLQSRAVRCGRCCHAGSGPSLQGLTRGLLRCALLLKALVLSSPLLGTLLLVSAMPALLLVGDGLVDDFLADGLHRLEQNAGVGSSERKRENCPDDGECRDDPAVHVRGPDLCGCTAQHPSGPYAASTQASVGKVTQPNGAGWRRE